MQGHRVDTELPGDSDVRDAVSTGAGHAYDMITQRLGWEIGMGFILRRCWGANPDQMSPDRHQPPSRPANLPTDLAIAMGRFGWDGDSHFD